MRVPQGRGAWAGRYNGLGGHIEQGEDPLTGARGRCREETGLSPGLSDFLASSWLTQGPGPASASTSTRVEHRKGLCAPVRAGQNGSPWQDLDRLPLVEDLPVLLPKVLSRSDGQAPFSALYRYDLDGRLGIEFAK